MALHERRAPRDWEEPIENSLSVSLAAFYVSRHHAKACFFLTTRFQLQTSLYGTLMTNDLGIVSVDSYLYKASLWCSS
jgi:hypothetical protein